MGENRVTPFARTTAALALAIASTVVAASYASTPASRIPDGVYRAKISAAFLRGAGIAASEAAHNSGIQTLIFRGARWTNRTVNQFHPPDCSGDLSYSGGRVTLTTDPGPQCGAVAGFRLFSARWSYAHGQLRFSALEPADAFTRAAWGGEPWTRIG